MNIYYHDEQFHNLHYNCSLYLVDSIPLSQRCHPIAGVALITIFVLFEAFYIPLLLVIWRHAQSSSCYKFMFFIGIVDVLSLFVSGLTQGIYAIYGLVYCSAPTPSFFAGYAAHRELNL